MSPKVLGGAADGEETEVTSQTKPKRRETRLLGSDFLLIVDLTTMAAPSSDGIGIANLPNQVRLVLCIYICLEGPVDENYISLAT